MAKCIHELLDLPTQVNKGDFVLNLAAGVAESNTMRSQGECSCVDGLTSVGEIGTFG